MSTPREHLRRMWPDRQTLWRWHFYAGLFCIPFVLWLAVTGSIYLFRPQIEAAMDRPYDNLAPGGRRLPPSAEVRAALGAAPGSVLHAYQLPRSATGAAQILIGVGADETRVWIDPRSGRVLKKVREEDRLMPTVFRLHGELLMGDTGSILVELAASWALVMIITGLALWWPRGTQGAGGLLYPRLSLKGRLFWRDVHAVAAFWISATTILLLVSGLPWATSWGAYLKGVREVAGGMAVHQDWPTGARSRSADLAARSAGSRAAEAAPTPRGQGPTVPPARLLDGGGGEPAMAGMAMGGGAKDPPPASQAEAGPTRGRAPYQEIDTIAPTVRAQGLAPPVLITPPMTPGARWGARSDAQNRTLRASLVLDADTGALLDTKGFDRLNVVDQAVGVGVAAHEGQLFGWPNQLMNLLTAAGLVTASLSAVLMWMKRRTVGALGAPAPGRATRMSPALCAVLLGLALILPLFGASMVLVLLVERLVLRRTPGLRDWLGLGAVSNRPARTRA